MSDGDDTDWHQEYRQLKEEFEKYKVRVMSARKKDPYVPGGIVWTAEVRTYRVALCGPQGCVADGP